MTRPTSTAPEQAVGSPEESAPARREQAEAHLRRLSGEVTVLENFEARLTRQIHSAQEAGRDDYVRELLQRRISVRARLEEMVMRRGRAREELEHLG